MTEGQLRGLIIGESRPIRQLRAELLRLAPSSARVLIFGPTGSGKELVAQAVHTASKRSGRLVAINICAIPDTMFESAVFGHVRGAFTGSTRDSAGFLAEADQGTLFLDEISGLGVMEQAKLLRALETGEFRPVGANRDRRSSFRIVSATNEDLAEMVEAGGFRADLWFRLRGAILHVPPLRDRMEDLPRLVDHFLQQMTESIVLTVDARRMLQEYHWPGNVRELRHVIEGATALATDGIVTHDIVARLLGLHVQFPTTDRSHEQSKEELLELLINCAWDTARAASELGVHRVTIYRRIQRLGITLPTTKRGALIGNV